MRKEKKKGTSWKFRVIVLLLIVIFALSILIYLMIKAVEKPVITERPAGNLNKQSSFVYNISYESSGRVLNEDYSTIYDQLGDRSKEALNEALEVSIDEVFAAYKFLVNKRNCCEEELAKNSGDDSVSQCCYFLTRAIAKITISFRIIDLSTHEIQKEGERKVEYGESMGDEYETPNAEVIIEIYVGDAVVKLPIPIKMFGINVIAKEEK